MLLVFLVDFILLSMWLCSLCNHAISVLWGYFVHQKIFRSSQVKDGSDYSHLVEYLNSPVYSFKILDIDLVILTFCEYYISEFC